MDKNNTYIYMHYIKKKNKIKQRKIKNKNIYNFFKNLGDKN